jgi:metallo-beta-lactamase family protein
LLHYQRSDSYYLIDCGMYQGFPGDSERNRRKFDFDPARLSAVFLTHAHIDHCGLLPRLVAQGFTGPIICTQATAELTTNALFDSAHIEGLYTKQEVRKVRELFKCPDEENPRFQFGHFYPIEMDLFYGFLRTAHVTGSVAVEFRLNMSSTEPITVLFSGDIGPGIDGGVHGGLLKSRHYPNPSTNFLLVESTYGGRTRDPAAGGFDSRIEALAAALRDAFARSPDPVVLFPAFTLQRTQEVLADLHYVFTRTLKTNGAVPTVILDSPLASYHTRAIHKDFLRLNAKGKRVSLNDVSPLFAGLPPQEIDALVNTLFDINGGPRLLGKPGAEWRLVYRPEKGFSATGPQIFISGSGTCLAGPIIKHLSEHLTNPQATVVLTGYQPPGAPGDLLKQINELPEDKRGSLTIKLGEESIPGSSIKAAVCDLAPFFSGHADEAGLVDFTLRNDTGEPTPPLTVFINHGDPKARLALKARLEAAVKENTPGLRALRNVFLPDAAAGWFDFVKEAWVPDGASQAGSAQVAELKEMLLEVLENQREILEILKNR